LWQRRLGLGWWRLAKLRPEGEHYVPAPQNKAVHSQGFGKALQATKKAWNFREGGTEDHKILRGRRIKDAQRQLHMPPLRLRST
jgi:hypothetical protein